METLQYLTIGIFLVSILFVITGWIDSVLAALLGVMGMIFIGVMNDVDAFKIVDWNVIAILLSIWIISGYFGRSGVPDALAAWALKLSKGNVAFFIVLIGFIAGLVSMVIDNVVVVLMFAPVVFHACRKFKVPAFPATLFVGLCANFMGTAMLLGDLPPQMLHSVSKIEFSGFIWFMGRPSSFFILLFSYFITCGFFYWKFSRRYKVNQMGDIATNEHPLDHIKDKPFAIVSCGIFLLTIIAMAFRPFFGYMLGFIAMWGAIASIIFFEIFKDRFTVENPDMEGVLRDLDWRAIFFYISLFMLVGALEHAGVIKLITEAITPDDQEQPHRGQHGRLLGHGADRRDRRARRLHPRPALRHPGSRHAGDQPLAALLDAPLGGDTGQQPDDRRRPGPLRRQEPGRKGGPDIRSA